MASNNMYGNVSAGGLWDTVKGTIGGALSSVGGSMAPPIDNSGKPINPYAGFEPKNMAGAQGNLILSTRDKILGEDSDKAVAAEKGAIPTPDAQQPTTDANGQPTNDQSPVNVDLATGRLFRDPSAAPAKPAVDQNSQAGGAAAKATQQEDMDAAKQQVADDAYKGGGVPTPVTIDPARAFAERNQNIQAGVGNQITGTNTVTTPQALTDQQQKNADLHQAGQDTFKSMNTIGDWFQSPSFLMGMMQTGLSLLDGKGYAESFATGAAYFDQHYSMEQRRSWGDDLLNKGYDRQQIEEYIRTGDSKILKSPQEMAQQKQMDQLKLDQAQQQVLTQKYANDEAAYKQSDEYREYQIQQDQINNQYKQNQIQYQNWNMAQKQAEAPYKLQAMKANAQNAQTRALAAQQKFDNQVKPVINSQGMAVRLGGTVGETNDRFTVLNASGSPIVKNGMILSADKDGNHQQYMAGNPGASHQAILDSNRALRNINTFDTGGGVSLFGPTGDIRREFGDMWGQRTSATMKSRLSRLQKQLEAIATNGLILEQSGIRPSNAEIEHKVGAMGSLLDEHGEPLDISQEEAADILQGYRDYASQVAQGAEAQLGNTSGGNPGSGETTANMSRYVPPGTPLVRNGVKLVSVGGPYGDRNTWVVQQ